VSILSFRDWLRQHPPDTAFGQSLAEVATRVIDGDDFLVAARELLDELVLLSTDAQRRRAIEAEPPETGDRRYDAYLGALGEHLALTSGLDRPEWTLAGRRFLDTFWFQSNVAGHTHPPEICQQKRIRFSLTCSAIETGTLLALHLNPG
jgi:hypothetical protein